MIDSLGKRKRLNKIFKDNGRTFMVPIDDLLISGPENHLSDFEQKVLLFDKLPIDAVLGYPGFFYQFHESLRNKAWIFNLTTSTKFNNYTYKMQSLSLKNAIYNGADAVAVHVNISSPNENEMIKTLGSVSCECQSLGIPLMAIMYVRHPSQNNDDNYENLKRDDNDQYVSMVAHACRVAVELGADIIKTSYTGTPEGFKKVIKTAGNVPIIISGGDIVSEDEALNNISGAISVGSSGVCFGRNFFARNDVVDFSRKVNMIIQNG